jgi:hypothetical protein
MALLKEHCFLGKLKNDVYFSFLHYSKYHVPHKLYPCAPEAIVLELTHVDLIKKELSFQGQLKYKYIIETIN